MQAIRGRLAAVGLGVAVAFSATGAAASTTVDLTFEGFHAGSRNVTIDAKVDGVDRDLRAAAGTFSISDTAETFVAWCIDITRRLHRRGTAREYARQEVLGDAARGRLQRLFDTAYAPDDVFASNINTAAFQVAIWDAIYDDDWDAGGADVSKDDYFRVIDSRTQNYSEVLSKANAYLALAEDLSNPAPQRWTLTEFDGRGSGTQSLVTVAATPLPGGVVLLLSGFGAAAAMRRRRKAA